MKKDKGFNAVKMMRKIRDQMSKEIKGMTPKEQIEYIEKKSGLQREEKIGLLVSQVVIHYNYPLALGFQH